MKEEKLRILKMVKDGELSIEEAGAILEELDRENDQKKMLAPVVLEKEDIPESENEPFTRRIQSSKEKLFSFVDTAIQKIKDNDLDFNFGSSHTVQHIFQQESADFSKIQVEIANGKLKLEPWDRPGIQIESTALVYQKENQDEARNDFIKQAYFAIEDRKLCFHVVPKTIKVDAVLYVPRNVYENVSIRLFNGPVDLSRIEAESIKVKTANGSIIMDCLKAESCAAETGSGKIAITDSEIEKLEAESLHGAIDVEGIYKTIEAKSFNGRISCSVRNAECEQIQAKSVTGALVFKLPAGAGTDGELKSNLGGFTISMDGVEVVEEKNDVIHKVLKFKTNKAIGPTLYLLADTKTGGITVN